ncbi:MAG: hypothetical protein ACE15C_15770 [Phycisphaerae bacterium]
MIDFKCPKCGKLFSLGDEWAGRAGRCPSCQEAITVPSAPAGQEVQVLQAAAPPPPQYAAPPPYGAPPYGPYGYPQPFIPPKPVSKGFYVGSYVGGTVVGFVLFAIGYVIMITAMVSAAESARQSRYDRYDNYPYGRRSAQPAPPNPAAMMTASGVMCLAYPAIIYAVVVGMVLLYKMWSAIQAGPARTSPGKAVGFLFIPFFNLYWMFMAWWGWAKDYNEFIRLRNISAPKVSENLALTMCILALIPCASIANLVIMPMFMAKGCDAINALAALRPAGAVAR